MGSDDPEFSLDGFSLDFNRRIVPCFGGFRPCYCRHPGTPYKTDWIPCELTLVVWTSITVTPTGQQWLWIVGLLVERLQGETLVDSFYIFVLKERLLHGSD